MPMPIIRSQKGFVKIERDNTQDFDEVPASMSKIWRTKLTGDSNFLPLLLSKKRNQQTEISPAQSSSSTASDPWAPILPIPSDESPIDLQRPSKKSGKSQGTDEDLPRATTNDNPGRNYSSSRPSNKRDTNVRLKKLQPPQRDTASYSAPSLLKNSVAASRQSPTKIHESESADSSGRNLRIQTLSTESMSSSADEWSENPDDTSFDLTRSRSVAVKAHGEGDVWTLFRHDKQVEEWDVEDQTIDQMVLSSTKNGSTEPHSFLQWRRFQGMSGDVQNEDSTNQAPTEVVRKETHNPGTDENQQEERSGSSDRKSGVSVKTSRPRPKPETLSLTDRRRLSAIPEELSEINTSDLDEDGREAMKQLVAIAVPLMEKGLLPDHERKSITVLARDLGIDLPAIPSPRDANDEGIEYNNTKGKNEPHTLPQEPLVESSEEECKQPTSSLETDATVLVVAEDENNEQQRALASLIEKLPMNESSCPKVAENARPEPITQGTRNDLPTLKSVSEETKSAVDTGGEEQSSAETKTQPNLQLICDEDHIMKDDMDLQPIKPSATPMAKYLNSSNAQNNSHLNAPGYQSSPHPDDVETTENAPKESREATEPIFVYQEEQSLSTAGFSVISRRTSPRRSETSLKPEPVPNPQKNVRNVETSTSGDGNSTQDPPGVTPSTHHDMKAIALLDSEDFSESHPNMDSPIGATLEEIAYLNTFLRILGSSYGDLDMSLSQREEVYRRSINAGIPDDFIQKILDEAAGIRMWEDWSLLSDQSSRCSKGSIMIPKDRTAESVSLLPNGTGLTDKSYYPSDSPENKPFCAFSSMWGAVSSQMGEAVMGVGTVLSGDSQSVHSDDASWETETMRSGRRFFRGVA